MFISSLFHSQDTLIVMRNSGRFSIGCSALAETPVVICNACPEKLASHPPHHVLRQPCSCAQAAAAACRVWSAGLWPLLHIC